MSKKAWFEKYEKTLLAQLQSSIKEALHVVGEDVKCIDWFCSKAEENIAKRSKKAA